MSVPKEYVAEELAGGTVVAQPDAPGQPRRGLAGSALFYGALAVGTLGVWQMAAAFTNPLFLPPPAEVGRSFVALLQDGTLLASIGASYARILVGWLLGSLVGIPAGLLMASNRVVRFVLDPYLQVFRFLPAIAILPLLILWVGSGEASKIALIVYATAFVVALATLDGALRVDRTKLQAARCLGASPHQIFWLVTLPATVPSIISGMRIAMGGAFLAIVSAEMLAASEGLGYLIANSRVFMLTPHIFVAIICLGLLGLLTDRLIRYVSQRWGYRYQAKM